MQNVTDIDDPLLERADRDGEDWLVLAMRETALFREDMEALRIIPPAHYVGAVESIPAIAAHGARAARPTARPTGSTTAPATSTSPSPRRPAFGYESQPVPRARCWCCPPSAAATPSAPASATRSTRCCGAAPATASRPGTAATSAPAAPAGTSSAPTIALDLLGDTIDVQGGGNDLLYPHHECSAAHAEVLTGEAPFARHYVHAGMIGLDGEKMSKSKGNLVFVSRLRADGVDPMAVRLAPARRPLPHRPAVDRRRAQGRPAAAGPLARGRRGADRPVRRGACWPRSARPLADDLDTPGALALVDAWADAALAGAGETGAPRLMAATVDALLGVDLST